MKHVVEITPAGCGEMFSDWGKHTTKDSVLIETPEQVSLVVFTGGSDVCPQMYGENCGRWTSFNMHRDLYESKMFDIAVKHKIPCVGICRGSQFLCVKAGGKLVQDLNGHGGRHGLTTSCGKRISCNSTHHQMQLPPKDALVLAWAEPKLSRKYLNGDDDEIEVEKEIEVVYYPNINSIGIQGHPEWLSDRDTFVVYSKEVVAKYLFPKTE